MNPSVYGLRKSDLNWLNKEIRQFKKFTILYEKAFDAESRKSY